MSVAKSASPLTSPPAEASAKRIHGEPRRRRRVEDGRYGVRVAPDEGADGGADPCRLALYRNIEAGTTSARITQGKKRQAVSCRYGIVTSTVDHASAMVQMLRRQRGILAPMGSPFAWTDVLDVVVSLELAHPQLADKAAPRLEYPWEDVRGQIRWPARDLRIAKSLGDPQSQRGNRTLRFAELLSAHLT